MTQCTTSLSLALNQDCRYEATAFHWTAPCLADINTPWLCPSKLTFGLLEIALMVFLICLYSSALLGVLLADGRRFGCINLTSHLALMFQRCHKKWSSTPNSFVQPPNPCAITTGCWYPGMAEVKYLLQFTAGWIGAVIILLASWRK